jgi:radical SAM superfamily enzyme YgiQ (UPF0313 family)
MADPGILYKAQKPGRYLGGEVNEVVKDGPGVDVRFALAFPDTYEIGMSHAGIKILYSILNAIPGVWAQRVFAPWHDMAGAMKAKGLELCSLEENRPLKSFDVVGFSLLYELSYTSVVRMLKLSGIPVRAEERGAGDPIVIAGGTSVVNPGPFLAFVDLVVIGDGEEVVSEMARICLKTKDRAERLAAMGELTGVYCPGSGTRPKRRILRDLDAFPFPHATVLPHVSIVHDRIGAEVARGCNRGCRFCQAGMIYRPYRERSFESVMETLRKSLTSTGYDTIAMLALSMTDLSYINTVMESIACPSREISIGVPSLRVEGITQKVADILSSVKKPGFTMAPEAATERLRRVINKGNTEEDLFRSAAIARDLGWKALKLYFMVGLPTERQEDIEAICNLSRSLSRQFKGQLTISISGFIPKPWTPFQWQGQISLKDHVELLRYLQSNLRQRNIGLKWQEPGLTFLEGVFARGDERLAAVVEAAEQEGAYLDGWGDTFNQAAWDRAFEKTGVDPAAYLPARSRDEALPWEFIDMGIERTFLLGEEARAREEQTTPDCRLEGCTGCGVCKDGIGNILYKETGPVPLFSADREGEQVPYVVKLTKEGDMGFISPRDFLEAIKRAVRRSGLNAVYSKGFSPIMKLSTSPPPPFGIASLSEFIQFDLKGAQDPAVILAALNRVLPRGVAALSCTRGKLGLAQAFVYETARPFTLNIEPGSVVTKGDKALAVDEYLSAHDQTTLTISVRDGRTISPLAILEGFSPDGIQAWEITKVETRF